MSVTIKVIRRMPGYFVGDDGSVWTAWRTRRRVNGGRGVESYIGQDLKEYRQQKTKQDGYHRVNLRKDGRYYGFLVHRLVLETFVGPCPEGMEGCHEDGNKSNNSVGNLYWGTRQDNMNDSVRLGTTARGEDNARAKLTEEEVKEIRQLIGHCSQERIAKMFNVTQTAVSLIKRGINWKYCK